MIDVQNHAFSAIVWIKCEEVHFESRKQYSAPAGALTMFFVKTHYTWPFSIAMLNYQRVSQVFNESKPKKIIVQFLFQRFSKWVAVRCQNVQDINHVISN